jgi:hypothetical protein
MILGIGIGIPFGRRGGFTGLLDLYPNAAMAYSLRKLRKAYSGSAVRIRRSSDNAESDIGFLANGDFDLAAAVAFCGVGNGFITTWYDQSTAAVDATETTAANQPQIIASGVILTKNGKPAMVFDGVNDQLSALVGTVGTSTFFNVVGFNSLQTAFRSFFGGQNAFRKVGGQNASVQYYISDGVDLSTGITRDTNQKLFYALFNSTNSEVAVNNVLTSGNAGTLSVTNIWIGRSFFGELANVAMQELIMWKTNESANRTGIQTNLNAYYGIY